MTLTVDNEILFKHAIILAVKAGIKYTTEKVNERKYNLTTNNVIILNEIIEKLKDHYPKFCKYCYTKLISDKLSEKYGNYCPNLKCDHLK